MRIHGHGTGYRFGAGFTVLELMITLSIACILLVAGVPSFQAFSQRQHMKAAVSNLQNDLMMGRSEAVRLNAHVVTCPGNPASGCTGGSDWSGGWIVFDDVNADRQHQASEAIVRQAQGMEYLIIRTTAGRTDFRFFPDGSAPGSNGSIRFCGMGGPEQARKLVISNLGRIRRDLAPETDEADCPM